MRGTANLWSCKSLLVVAGGLTMVLGTRGAAVADDAKNGPMEAILRPVNRTTGAMNPDISLGSAQLKPSGDKTQIVIQVNGISIGGSEEGAAADGTGNVYPRAVQLFAGTCETAVKSGPTGAERLPDLPVRSDGSGTLFATSATPIAKLAGQLVYITKPNKPGDPNGVPVACGTIQAK